MRIFQPTARCLFLSILSFGVVTYVYISYSGLGKSLKLLRGYKDSARVSEQLNVTVKDDKHLLNTSAKGAVAGASELGKVNWESWLEKEQSRRLATLKAYCRENSQSTTRVSHDLLKYQLIFFENIKTAYCFIPKTGCSTMKLLLYNLEHNTTERPVHSINRTSNVQKHVGINARRFRMLRDYSKEQASLRLATFKKIIVVRDPLERLASAWLDKFVKNSEVSRRWTKTFHQHVKAYLKERYRNIKSINMTFEGKAGGADTDTQPVSFADFLGAISQRIWSNVHWISFSKLCLPCEVDYDYIAHTDTLAADVRLFLQQYNITAREDILPEQRLRRANDGNVFGNIFGQVPKEEILSIRRLYQEDFDMFGYSFEEDLAKIETGRG
ncbi:carbohydrate sulfotransferase 11-like [Branchiostoma floridae]|uniref:Carbohydrate sulfotransferase n=1 Tax=Branchiostoma floridae TaxID=7739 RepID=A0A9J7LF51_BRAFL|nr:carbohydrate sulfotransferase 11-like [Branchiostoma floridae]